MKAPRKTRIDTVFGAIEAVQAAKREIKPPRNVKLDRGDKPFFNSLLAEFARAELSDHTIELLAMLARAMADLEREQRQLREEGSVTVASTGKRSVNPRQTVVSNLSAAILSMRRSLSLQAHAKNGDARDIASRRQSAKTIEADTVANDLLGIG